MVDVLATSITGADAVISESDIEGLRAGFRGTVLCPGDYGYDEARKVWNGMIDKKPALIARCAGVADVITSVNFARENSLLMSVRGGGHNAAGSAVCNGGLMVDLAGMKGIRVDLEGLTVRAEPGVLLADLDHETQAFGLAAPAGTVSDTGIAGLTLGGGLGWLAGEYGLTCDNVVSMDIVTSDGRLLTASATGHPDLFWGLRGGGGNFGVITSFEYRLYPVGPMVLGGMVIHPFDKAREVLRFYDDFAAAIPDQMNTLGGLMTTPEGQLAVSIAACYHGSFEEGEKALKPLREFGPPLMDTIGPMPFVEVQKMLDQATMRGNQYYIRSNFMGALTNEAIDILVSHFANVTSPLSGAFFQQLGPAANRVDLDETAFAHRNARYELVEFGAWTDPGESEIHIRWVRELAEKMYPFSTGGVYVNQVGWEAEEGEDQIRAAYGRHYDRLAALKEKYDPSNLFRHNQNVRPRT